MGLLTSDDAARIQARLDELERPVNVTVFSEPVSSLYVPGVRPCLTCRETEQLMTEVAELSDAISLRIVDVKAEPETADEWGVTLTPTISVTTDGDNGVRFLGIPGGYEFTSFLETVVSAGRQDLGLMPETLERVQKLEGDLAIKTFTTPT